MEQLIKAREKLCGKIACHDCPFKAFYDLRRNVYVGSEVCAILERNVANSKGKGKLKKDYDFRNLLTLR